MKKFFTAVIIAAFFSAAAQQRVNIQVQEFYMKAKAGNREKAAIMICVTDQIGALVRLAPEDVSISEAMIPEQYNGHFRIEELTTNASGTYSVWIVPEAADKWRSGNHVFVVKIKNAQYQGAAMATFPF